VSFPLLLLREVEHALTEACSPRGAPSTSAGYAMRFSIRAAAKVGWGVAVPQLRNLVRAERRASPNILPVWRRRNGTHRRCAPAGRYATSWPIYVPSPRCTRQGYCSASRNRALASPISRTPRSRSIFTVHSQFLLHLAMPWPAAMHSISRRFINGLSHKVRHFLTLGRQERSP
jgi:hypothetical protein